MARGTGTRDMTEGSPMRLILGFFVPMPVSYTHLDVYKRQVRLHAHLG